MTDLAADVGEAFGPLLNSYHPDLLNLHIIGTPKEIRDCSRRLLSRERLSREDAMGMLRCHLGDDAGSWSLAEVEFVVVGVIEAVQNRILGPVEECGT